MFWWMAVAMMMNFNSEKFQIMNLAPHCNQTLHADWNDPNSFAGLIAGKRWVLGVPFVIVDPVLNKGKAIVRNAEIPINASANFLFALISNSQPNAQLILRFADGKEQKFSLAEAVPVIIAHPPLYSWHIDMVVVKAGYGTRGTGQMIRSVRVEGTDLFALTLSTHSESELRETLTAIKRKQNQWREERKLVMKLNELKETLLPLKGQIVVLPVPPPESARSHPLFSPLSKSSLTENWTMLSPSQLIDETFFTAQRFPIALYLSGERSYYTVREQNDAVEAIRKFLRDGGILLVFASQPFPFYYDQSDKVVGNSEAFGLPIRGGWEEPPKGIKFNFHLNPNQNIVTDLPEIIPFPTEGDLRWRPIVKPKGVESVDFIYTPILTLRDDKGNEYGDGVAILEYRKGDFAYGRLVYVWHTLWQTEARLPLLTGLLRWAVQTVQERPPIAQTIVYRTSKPIRIDGILDEPEWQMASPLELKDIKGRSAPKTFARLLWDDRYLYIAFDCSDDDIWATKTQRDDFLWEEEVVEAFIDPDGDGLNYYEFQVNPLGTEIDLLIPDAIEGVKHAKRNAQWNCQGWLSAVKVHGTVNKRDDTDEGWTVEMAIPLSELTHPSSPVPRPGIAWRLNLYRIERPKGKEDDPLLLSWSKCVSWFHEPERFARITFAGNPYADDFALYPDGSDGRPTWMPLSGEWQIQDKVYYGANGGTDGWIASGSKIGFDWWRNYEVNVRFKVLEFGSDWRDGFWLGFRWADVNNAYSLNFYHGQDGMIHLHKARDGISTGDDNPLASAKWRPDNEWHEVTVRVEGKRITAWLDGKELFSVVDENFNGVAPVEHGAVVLSPRRWSQSKGSTKIAISKVNVRLLE
ncbi:MAG: carbohydrate-binding family 9-like protein [Armatimonadetes bacterium]|nr:carbohydrate-binding family 9-like protein [Armatimonadota bacterium]